MNTLYYGDCLGVLLGMDDACVDLIYLDPPFNSKRDYNAFFSTHSGKESTAQVTAFEDTWQWGQQAESEYQDLLKSTAAGALGETLMPALRAFLGESDMMAYLVMMASRLTELRRVLKDTGSLYLHCDPTASHYIKLVLDSLFGAQNYRNEIVWKRTNAKSNTIVNFPTVHDVIFRYTKSDSFTFNKQYTEYDAEYINTFYKYKDDDGRRFQLDNLLNPNKNRPNLTYEFLGVTRVWRWTKERMQKALEEGRIVQSKPGAVPRYKRYLDEMPGMPIMDVWTDIWPLQGGQQEYLGYPTQKPVALLERIINTSSNPGDIVLDPFCGCGTAVHAAEKLNRRWIGIDITHLAISLISRRLRNAFPDCQFEVKGTPEDVEAALYLAVNNGLDGRYQFQYWALSFLEDAVPAQDKKKGADGGSDGYIWAYNDPHAKKPYKINISVKSGKIPANHIRELGGMLGKSGVEICVLLTLEAPSKKMVAEAASYGFYEYPNGKQFPRVQILTIQDLFDGKRPQYLNYDPTGNTVIKKAKQEKVVPERLSLI